MVELLQLLGLLCSCEYELVLNRQLLSCFLCYFPWMSPRNPGKYTFSFLLFRSVCHYSYSYSCFCSYLHSPLLSFEEGVYVPFHFSSFLSVSLLSDLHSLPLLIRKKTHFYGHF